MASHNLSDPLKDLLDAKSCFNEYGYVGQHHSEAQTHSNIETEEFVATAKDSGSNKGRSVSDKSKDGFDTDFWRRVYNHERQSHENTKARNKAEIEVAKLKYEIEIEEAKAKYEDEIEAAKEKARRKGYAKGQQELQLKSANVERSAWQDGYLEGWRSRGAENCPDALEDRPVRKRERPMNRTIKGVPI